MKSLIQAVCVTAVFAFPAFSFAQSSQPVTRADVSGQLVQFEQATPSHAAFPDSNASYPVATLTAEQKVSAQNGAASAGFGGVAESTSGSGAGIAPVSPAAWRSMYDHP
ncbi:DUF4148 domain-containing protein [Caballeronia sp. dw_19]|jgi:hypothetical protein|uniref:DUF4148 domain-containing protein n=1 Tax=unclassified Caballeronia TaxID=2646786 RepID=UPI001BD31FAD